MATGAYSSTGFFLVEASSPCMPGVAQRRRHRQLRLSLGQAPWSGGGTTSSSSSSAWCGPASVPALGHQRVPNRSAVDECSDAVILADVFLVTDILVAVVDREIEALSGAAPEVVEAKDGCPRILCDDRTPRHGRFASAASGKANEEMLYRARTGQPFRCEVGFCRHSSCVWNARYHRNRILHNSEPKPALSA